MHNAGGALGNALEPQGLQQLRSMTRNPSEEDLAEVARQFEAVFVEMMLGQMRQATPGDEIFGGNAEETYRDLFDRQMAVQMSREGGGMGLAPMIEEQLRENAGFETDRTQGLPRDVADYRHSAVPVQPDDEERAAAAEEGDETGRGGGLGGKGAGWSSPQAFVEEITPAAKETAERLGVPAVALVAQAALETGWGQHMVADSDGRSSNNLFNIKAHSADWQGDAVRVPTLEYRNGIPQREMADFRAYESVADSFADYADFLERNPRYREALEVGEDAGQYVEALQRAGYATDPQYAEKLQRIMELGDDSHGVRIGGETLKISDSVPKG
ncbi:flagellar assembly peptidoglycan hydrolase FlgJ [Halorhodospira halophila]|uniref:Peptidoglycan hydrolase FlgJ n=1 Tax=Halorhodospira halophila (strain DSM 244 / SL1) TaxID=349124 RepID=A1WUD7_HALHL|nr:flagellar assembly peptidoglycan hydrolase FlgJ [Halorhodospira halophila]ABM61299.1 flagellar rod assembly protein/muramidase FlgJ [Halorhodospira halophila SL1]MBK1729119.1 flagellar assembly peptidoglycan hydrolase FlgJ [Halorhodospira halophila]